MLDSPETSGGAASDFQGLLQLLVPCRSLVALLAAAPVAAAAALLPEFRSPHLDVHQRLLVCSRVLSKL